MVFIKAKETGKRRVTYWDADGTEVTFIGGNRTWLNQNPGDIGAGSWAKQHGAIGKARGFAIFPNYKTGRAAIFDLLKSEGYINQTIWDAIPHYAPAKDNDVKRYRRLIREFTGFDLNRKIKDLSAKELEKLVNAIERVEGKFKAGKIIKTPTKDKKDISAVRKDRKGTNTAYYVEDLGWLSKSEAIRLAVQGKIDEVVATSRSGSKFLRARPNQIVEDNLDSLG